MGLSAHRCLSNSSKYIQPMGLCYYFLIRRKALLFTSKNKLECDRTSVGKALMFSAVQWPTLVILLVWLVLGCCLFQKENLNVLEGLLPWIIKASALLLNFSTNTASSVTGPLYAP